MATPCEEMKSPQVTLERATDSHDKREERMDSFELDSMDHSSLPSHGSQQTSLACVMSAAISARSSSPSLVSTTSSTLAPLTSIVAPLTALPSGIALESKVHEFLGHDGIFLNDSELKTVLGSPISAFSRPSILNALAFKCKQPCCHGQCSKFIDEINLFHLRQAWASDVTVAGFSASARTSVKQWRTHFFSITFLHNRVIRR